MAADAFRKYFAIMLSVVDLQPLPACEERAGQPLMPVVRLGGKAMMATPRTDKGSPNMAFGNVGHD